MFYAESENKYIHEGTQFTLNGITYPSQWLNQATEEQKQAIGLEEVTYTNSPKSDKYYWVSQEFNGATVTYVNNPKDLDSIKTNEINQTKSTAYSILQPTDYIDLRNLRDPSYKPEWITWRDQVRQAASDHISAIEAAATIEDIEQLTLVWPEQPQ